MKSTYSWHNASCEHEGTWWSSWLSWAHPRIAARLTALSEECFLPQVPPLSQVFPLSKAVHYSQPSGQPPGALLAHFPSYCRWTPSEWSTGARHCSCGTTCSSSCKLASAPRCAEASSGFLFSILALLADFGRKREIRRSNESPRWDTFLILHCGDLSHLRLDSYWILCLFPIKS